MNMFQNLLQIYNALNNKKKEENLFRQEFILSNQI